MVERDTVGKISSELIAKPLESETPFEQMSEQLSDWDKSIFECLEAAKKNYGTSDFYLVVITKKEKLMQNVLRNYFFATKACPSPTWDQTVYRYTHADEQLEYLWTVPDKATCFVFSRHRLLVKPEELMLLKFVIEFEDGTLLDKAKRLNGEVETPPVIKLDLLTA